MADQLTQAINFGGNNAANFLWNNSVTPCAFVSKDGDWLRTNKALCEMLEYTSSELMSKRFQDITHPEDVKDDENMVDKCIKGDIDGYPMTKRYLTKMGKVIWVRIDVLVLKDDKDEFLVFLTQVRPKDPGVSVPAAVAAKVSSITKESVGDYIKKNWIWISGLLGTIGTIAKYLIDNLSISWSG